MHDVTNINLNYDRPIKIADGIFWIGFYDEKAGLHCNPYFIIEGEEAVVIDSGSRPDFPTVMMKILQTGMPPSNIVALIYQHYDPDLCGSIPNIEDMINRDDLKLISDKYNNIFIRHYSVSSTLYTLEEVDFKFEFATGRTLEFVKTPYAHAAGSFVTFDRETGVLFSSDLFGGYSREWDLFISLFEECEQCSDYKNCPRGKTYCPLPDIFKFHKMNIPTFKSLQYALEQLEKIDYKVIAPQHGSVINNLKDIEIISSKLSTLKEVGIDGFLKE